MKKKRYGLLFALLLVMILIPASVFADTSGDFAGGDGSVANPYQITTKQHLNNVRNYPNANFILKNDITFNQSDFQSGGTFYNGGAGWIEFKTLNGVFDGNYHSIYNLKQYPKGSGTEDGPERIARSSFVQTLNGTIKNLALKNVTAKGDLTYEAYPYGGICGTNKGALYGCFISGTFQLRNCKLGGFACNNFGKIESCVSAIAHERAENGNNYLFAGFCFENKDGAVVSNCLNLSSLDYNSWDPGADCAFSRWNYGLISSCVNFGVLGYNTSLIEGQSLVNRQEGSLKNSYHYNPAVKNVKTLSGITTLNKAQLNDKSSYKNLDFSAKWTMNKNTNLPVPASNRFALGLKDTNKLFKIVQNFKAEAYTYKSIKLTWDKVSGATGYVITRDTNRLVDGDYGNAHTIIKSGDTTEYIDKADYYTSPNVMYYYHIAPVFEIDGVKYRGSKHGWANSTVVDTSSSSEYNDDFTGPLIKDVTVTTAKTTNPGVIKVKFTVADENSGVVAIRAGIHQSIPGREDEEEKTNTYEGVKTFTAAKEKTITVDIPIESDAQCGNYYLNIIEVEDKAGNTTRAIGCLLDGRVICIEEEFDIEFRGVLSNGYVARELKNMDSGKTVLLTIDDASKGILKKELLDAIKGQDKTLVVYANKSGSLQWVFYGKDITGTTKDLNLKVSIEKISAAPFGCSGSIVQLTYADNGKLPGDINFRLKSDYIKSINGLDDDLYLYYLNGKKVNLESSNCKVIRDGSSYWCYLDLDHNSKFLLSGKKLKHPLSKRTAKLSKVTYTYDGKLKKPTVTIKGLKRGEHYTVTYKNNKYVGKATVTIKGKGSYGGSITKTFTIKPKGTSLKSVSKGSKAFTVKWKKQSVQTTGYQICYSTSKKFTKSTTKYVKVKSTKTTTKKISKLKAKKKYYVKIRTYKVKNGKTYYSSWSKYKTVKTKR